jgi:regulatory protein
MIITAVKELKNGRFGLFEDEKFLFSLDAETFADCGLHAGDEIDEAQLEGIRDLADGKFAKEKALTLLSYRDHSKEELRRKLMRSAGQEAAEAAVGRMEEIGLVNDGEYAERLARELFENKAYGRNRVVYEMLQKGLDKELANSVAESLDDDPPARALRFLKKKYPRGVADEKARRRAAAALSRCGYDWQEIKQALKTYGTDEQDAD